MSQEHEVKYTLTLKDLLTGKLKSAEHEANAFHGTMSNIKKTALGMVGVLGLAFGGFQVAEYAKVGAEKFHELHLAESQVRAGLESTRGVAGLTFEGLEESAKGLSKQFAFSRAEITDMQAQLLTFPSVTKTTFGDASQSILDMSTRLHKGLNETAIMVGKALQDPARGITALRRVGVNFNQTQTDIIKKLAETGHAAEAQKMILKELQTEFAGSAKAAADSDPLFRYHKTMGAIQMSVGGVVMKLKAGLAPILERVANLFQGSISFMSKHRELLIAIGVAVGIVAGGLLIYETVMVATTVATKLMTVAQWLLNAAFWANPITLIVGGIALLAAGFIAAYRNSATFRAGLMGVWETMKEFARIVVDVFTGVGKVIHGTLTFNPSLVLEGANQTISAIANAGSRMGGAFHKGFTEGMADFAKDHAEEKKTDSPKSLFKKGALPGAGAGSSPTGTGAAAKTVGNKSTTIHVTINGGLAPHMQNTFTTINEGSKKIKEIMTQVMLSAVNDSQIIAGQ